MIYSEVQLTAYYTSPSSSIIRRGCSFLSDEQCLFLEQSVGVPLSLVSSISFLSSLLEKLTPNEVVWFATVTVTKEKEVTHAMDCNIFRSMPRV